MSSSASSRRARAAADRQLRLARGQQHKQDRLDRADRTRRRLPWLMPTIVVLAVLLVVGGITWAAILGKLF